MATYSPFLRFSGTNGQIGLPQLLRAFYLLEFQFDRGCPAKNADTDLDARTVEIQFLDNAVEARERAVEHFDRIADFIIDLDLGLGRGGGFFLGVQDAGGFGFADCLRLAPNALCRYGPPLPTTSDIACGRQLWLSSEPLNLRPRSLHLPAGPTAVRAVAPGKTKPEE